MKSYLEILQESQEAYDELKENKQDDIINFINHQINLDITDHIEPRFSNRKMITIWINNLSVNDVMNIERLANQFKKYRIEPNGHQKIALIF
jgi:hypothetical protein